MIPKKIHYCWFGKTKRPESFYAFLETWKEKLPDYEIKEWNESNFDIKICRYVEEAYENKKYAFVADYARIYALYTEGGVYFDTDVEVVKSFNQLLDDDFFIGYESAQLLGTSVIGSIPHFWFLDRVIQYYNSHSFITDKKVRGYTPNTEIISQLITEAGLSLDGKNKKEKGIAIYEYDYFSPYNSLTSKFVESNNTYSIHRFTNSWFPNYYLVEKRIWKALGLRNMKICLRLINLIKHGTIRGRLLD